MCRLKQQQANTFVNHDEEKQGTEKQGNLKIIILHHYSILLLWWISVSIQMEPPIFEIFQTIQMKFLLLNLLKLGTIMEGIELLQTN